MRRLLLAALLLVFLGLAVGSAAGLDVDGGVLQTFRVEADIDVPTNCETAEGAEATDYSPTSASSPATDSNVTYTSIGNPCPEGESTTREGD